MALDKFYKLPLISGVWFDNFIPKFNNDIITNGFIPHCI